MGPPPLVSDAPGSGPCAPSASSLRTISAYPLVQRLRIHLQVHLHWYSASHLAQQQHYFLRSHAKRDSGLGDVSCRRFDLRHDPQPYWQCAWPCPTAFVFAPLLVAPHCEFNRNPGLRNCSRFEFPCTDRTKDRFIQQGTSGALRH
jgi:hypothetical protein